RARLSPRRLPAPADGVPAMALALSHLRAGSPADRSRAVRAGASRGGLPPRALRRAQSRAAEPARPAQVSPERVPLPRRTMPVPCGSRHRSAIMPTAADILLDTLIDWEVKVVFGLPGDGINGIMEALRTRQDRIRFVQVRHEESAAFMACAYAKWT